MLCYKCNIDNKMYVGPAGRRSNRSKHKKYYIFICFTDFIEIIKNRQIGSINRNVRKTL